MRLTHAVRTWSVGRHKGMQLQSLPLKAAICAVLAHPHKDTADVGRVVMSSGLWFTLHCEKTRFLAYHRRLEPWDMNHVFEKLKTIVVSSRSSGETVRPRRRG